MNGERVRRQYGLWDSPITPGMLGCNVNAFDLAFNRDGTLVWLEERSGKGVLVIQPSGRQSSRDLNDIYSVQARVGYGGGDFTVGNGYVYFVDADSGGLFRQPLAAGSAKPLTAAFGNAASPVLSPDGKWLVFVHTFEEQDDLAVVDVEGHYKPQKLVTGDDFYMQPAWSHDGKRLAWIAWNHPNMPWDGTLFQMGKVARVRGHPVKGLPVVDEVVTVAGGEKVAVFQPGFSPDGRFLAYVSDESGWWQIYLYELKTGNQIRLTQTEAEHALPAWVQGMRTYAFSPDSQRIYFIRNQDSSDSLWQVDLDTREEQKLALDAGYTGLEQISIMNGKGRTGKDVIGLLASGGRISQRVITLQVSGEARIWRSSFAEDLPSTIYSQPEAASWQGMDGGQVHGLYYSPHNEQYEGTGKPPLIVRVHGGPTGQARNLFNLSAQFFATRGYAVLEVNYRGSTGYGRLYQDMLLGNWGVYDVQDSVSGARHFAEQGIVDGSKMVIMGSSAGGFTVLKALEDYPGFFRAGICLYGISNQFTAAVETHKFEKRYSDHLLGTLPEAADVYRERSPIYFLDRIHDPLALFQGEDDQVVRRNQSDEVAAVLARQGVPYIYHVYPGEGHGFRKSETTEHFYKAVEEFLRQYVV